MCFILSLFVVFIGKQIVVIIKFMNKSDMYFGRYMVADYNMSFHDN